LFPSSGFETNEEKKNREKPQKLNTPSKPTIRNAINAPHELKLSLGASEAEGTVREREGKGDLRTKAKLREERIVQSTLRL
jgi:hypothetical protein